MLLCGEMDRCCELKLGESTGATPAVATTLSSIDTGDKSWFDLVLESDAKALEAGCPKAEWCDTSDWNEDELERFFSESWAKALSQGCWYVCLTPAKCSEKQLEGALTLEEVIAEAKTGDTADPVFCGITGGTAAMEIWQLKEATLLQRRVEAREWFHNRICDLYEGVPADLANKIAGEAAVMWCSESDMPACNKFTDKLDEVLDKAVELKDGNGAAYAERLGEREPAEYVNQMTDELFDAVQTVCMHCPYISDCDINEELVELACADEEDGDPGAKYCDRCMVRKMCELYEAEDKAQAYLPFTSPEWQAIIHY